MRLTKVHGEWLLIGFIGAVLFTLSFWAVVYFFNRGNRIPTLKERIAQEGIDLSKATPLPIQDDGSINVVLIGYGGEGHSGGGLADAIQVLHIDPTKNIAAVISIPRDSWVSLPVRSDMNESHKINEAFSIGNSDDLYPLKQTKYKGPNGGGDLMKEAAASVTGYKISYYLAIDFNRFTQAIDKLEGIDVNVAQGFTDSFYPVAGLENETCGKSASEIADLSAKYSGFELEKQFTCRYETLTFEAGTTHMDGATALKFARSRHSGENGSDFARGVRQQEILVAIAKKVLTVGDVNKMADFSADFLNLVKTDVNLATAAKMTEMITNPQKYQIKQIPLTETYFTSSKNDSGQYILVPRTGNWGEIQQYIRQQL